MLLNYGNSSLLLLVVAFSTRYIQSHSLISHRGTSTAGSLTCHSHLTPQLPHPLIKQRVHQLQYAREREGEKAKRAASAAAATARASQHAGDGKGHRREGGSADALSSHRSHTINRRFRLCPAMQGRQFQVVLAMSYSIRWIIPQKCKSEWGFAAFLQVNTVRLKGDGGKCQPCECHSSAIRRHH